VPAGLRRHAAVASALLCVALAAAGCGFGAGPGVGEVTLTVTRDFGAERLAGSASEAAVESDTVMRVLDRNAEIATRYGGAFVQSIDGLEGTRRDGRPYDWFFYVNGLWSPVGAVDYPLRGGDSIWWDYRDWSASERVSALVGAWPQPFASGYEGSDHPTALECRGGGTACGLVRRRLRRAGATLVAAGSSDAIRVLVGPWRRLRSDSAAATVESGPAASGVYADFAQRGDGFELIALDEGGDPARDLGPDIGLVAATRRYGAPPVWLVTGTTASAASAAARRLDATDLRDHFAVAVVDDQAIPLPIPRNRMPGAVE
jgi:hypothetical protein